MRAYYNEFDKNAAAWLRELIKEGLITDGEVDERSIEDVLPADLAGFDRCHFFAGIGVWDHALNLAGFDGQVWTGSCPCQPFSTAGKREGTADERHLWPAFFHLVSQCRPDALFGEQVASTDGLAWLDIVQSDMEGIGYTIGAADLPVAGFGAPHRRQRLFFVADSKGGNRRLPILERGSRQARSQSQRRGKARIVAHTASGNTGTEGIQRSGEQRLQQEGYRASNLGNAEGAEQPRAEHQEGRAMGPSTTNGFWRNAEWIYCRDGKYRPTKSGIFPLANGITGRVALLRGAGNAISPWPAKAFIESYLESR